MKGAAFWQLRDQRGLNCRSFKGWEDALGRSLARFLSAAEGADARAWAGESAGRAAGAGGLVVAARS